VLTSYVYEMNFIGPSTEPCETLQLGLITTRPDDTSLKRKFWVLSVRYDSTHNSAELQTPKCCCLVKNVKSYFEQHVAHDDLKSVALCILQQLLLVLNMSGKYFFMIFNLHHNNEYIHVSKVYRKCLLNCFSFC